MLKPSSKMYFESRRLRRKAFTLVEIMMVVAAIALLAAMALPGFLRARKRSLAVRIRNDLRLIDSAVEQYAIETSKKPDAPVAIPDWTNYLKRDTSLYATSEDLLAGAAPFPRSGIS